MGYIAKYWKGVAPITDAQQGLRDASTAKVILVHKAAMEKAYAEAEKSAILANALRRKTERTSTDPAYLEAKKRIADLYALPELGRRADRSSRAPADAAIE